MDYLDRPSVVEFAQLALDVYNNSDDNKLRETEFNELWRKVDEWPHPDDFTRNTKVISTVNPRDPGLKSTQHLIKTDYDIHTGFYAAFYENFMTKVGVIAIRGTDPSVFLDLVADYEYVMNKVTVQYEEARDFVHLIENHYALSGIEKIYVCGHSLGGILAKMIAPLTGFDTIAFNSPGVKEYLINRHLPTHYFRTKGLPYKDAFNHQQIITYCAKACPIGNLRHDNDLGSYKFVDVLGGKQIPEKDDRIDGKNLKKALVDIKEGAKNLDTNQVYKGLNEIPQYEKILIKNRTKYHAMVDMYEALKVSEYQHDIF